MSFGTLGYSIKFLFYLFTTGLYIAIAAIKTIMFFTGPFTRLAVQEVSQQSNSKVEKANKDSYQIFKIISLWMSPKISLCTVLSERIVFVQLKKLVKWMNRRIKEFNSQGGQWPRAIENVDHQQKFKKSSSSSAYIYLFIIATAATDVVVLIHLPTISITFTCTVVVQQWTISLWISTNKFRWIALSDDTWRVRWWWGWCALLFNYSLF